MEKILEAIRERPLGSRKPTAQEPRNQGGRFYRPELDALRSLAFFSVFLCHALPTPHVGQRITGTAQVLLENFREAGNFGVCLFFFLSSFLITELLRRERLQTGIIHLKAFYIRRSLRIWPLYFSVVVLSYLIGLRLRALHMSHAAALAFSLFVVNWFEVFRRSSVPLNWLWSISVEEQFYLSWPVMAKLGGMRAVATASLICIPISAIAIVLANHWQGHPSTTVWLNSVVQFQFFAWGALVAIAAPRSRWQLRVAQRASLAGAGFLLWMVASRYCELKHADVLVSSSKLVLGYGLVALGCMCIFAATLGIEKPPSVLVYLGKVSYGLYVFHEMALSAMTAVRHHVEHAEQITSHSAVLFTLDRIFAFVVTICLAALSYRYLEKPFLRFKDRFALIHSRPA